MQGYFSRQKPEQDAQVSTPQDAETTPASAPRIIVPNGQRVGRRAFLTLAASGLLLAGCQPRERIVYVDTAAPTAVPPPPAPPTAVPTPMPAPAQGQGPIALPP